MKTNVRIVVFCIACITAVVMLVSAGQVEDLDLEKLLPVGEFHVTVLVPGMSPECAELAMRLKAAMELHAEYFLEAVQKVPPGEPLPYDFRMGLTEEEYEILLKCSKSLEMIEVGSGNLLVSSSEGVITLHGGGDLMELDGIQLDLKKDEVRTPIGTAGDRSSISFEQTADSPTGPWSGFQWKLESGENIGNLQEFSGKMINFSVGQRAGGGNMIYYNATVIESGLKTTRILKVFYYNLQAADGAEAPLLNPD